MAGDENILIESFLEARRALELDTIKKLDKSLEFYRNLLVNFCGRKGCVEIMNPQKMKRKRSKASLDCFLIAGRVLHAAQVNTAHKNPSRVENINTQSTKED